MVIARLKAAVEAAFFKRKTLNKNLAASIAGATDDQSLRLLVADAVRELQLAVSQLQEIQVRSAEVDPDGGPKHNAISQAFRGQFLRITSIGQDELVAVQHGLGRKPQGGIWIEARSFHKVFIQADRLSASQPVPAADESVVHVQMGGPTSEEAVLLLF